MRSTNSLWIINRHLRGLPSWRGDCLWSRNSLSCWQYYHIAASWWLQHWRYLVRVPCSSQVWLLLVAWRNSCLLGWYQNWLHRLASPPVSSLTLSNAWYCLTGSLLTCGRLDSLAVCWGACFILDWFLSACAWYHSDWRSSLPCLLNNCRGRLNHLNSGFAIVSTFIYNFWRSDLPLLS